MQISVKILNMTITPQNCPCLFQLIYLLCVCASECCIYFYSELYIFKERFKYIHRIHTNMSCLQTSRMIHFNRNLFLKKNFQHLIIYIYFFSRPLFFFLCLCFLNNNFVSVITIQQECPYHIKQYNHFHIIEALAISRSTRDIRGAGMCFSDTNHNTIILAQTGQG